MFSVSALSRFSAISNDVRVRVDGSKNRFTTVRPRRAGTFLIGRSPTSFIASAVSRISRIPSRVRSAMPRRCRPRREVTACAGAAAAAGAAVGVSIMMRLLEDHLIATIDFFETDAHALRQRGGKILAHVVRLDRQFAMATIDHDDELNCPGTAEVDQRVERGA